MCLARVHAQSAVTTIGLMRLDCLNKDLNKDLGSFPRMTRK